MPKHTPGSWFQSHRENNEGMYNTEVYTEDGKTIATLSWYPKPEANGAIGTYREANAHLIATAPKMYGYLKHLYDITSPILIGEQSYKSLGEILAEAEGKDVPQL